MARLIIPRWEDLRLIFNEADEELLLVSPFIAESGVDKVSNWFAEKKPDCICVYTRMSPSDWAKGISDPKALLYLLSMLRDEGVTIRIGVVQKLHAKLYSADRRLALLGSSNLSSGGFGGNLEMGVILEDIDAKTAVETFESACSILESTVSLADYETWVSANERPIAEVRAAQKDQDIGFMLADSQKSLDELLLRTRKTPKTSSARRTMGFSTPELTLFIAWLRSNGQAYPGADVILARADNCDGQNLTGHLKQCYYAIADFLEQHPEWKRPLVDALIKLRPGMIFSLDSVSTLGTRWEDHLDESSSIEDERHSYPVLRGILPPSVGGTRSGGGGGISTLKRLFPLVAIYYSENGIG